ncbi:hypothetical protein BD626DRAFT_635348 [Schizophyllum amplum]|uniref:Uncharacterized protein n=1 Tax=Schizophyllum amplum TaxID=97359 RepID=A0A550BWB2_9AGAR|nr:hypothetical protein BD626DRAFT_635348 [Auriculariopsis ampla]
MEENDEQTESALLKAYNAIMTLIPGFSEYLLAMPRHSIAALIHEMQDICNRARGDDTHLLRNLVLVAILDDPLTDRLNPPLLESDPKVRRGINHPQFARQIVPFAVYDDLVDEATHDATIAGMQKGTIKINDDSLSMIFWAPKERDPDDEEQGMGRNPLLVRLYRGLWLGKTKAYAAPSSVPRGCNAQAHGHLRVTAESIAYVAMQARFACSAVTDWKLADGDWTMQAFYKNIIEALYLDEDDPDEWAEETLRWWNTEIFGKPEGAEEETIAADEKEASHELKNCRSKREARAAKRAAARRAKAAQAAVV